MPVPCDCSRGDSEATSTTINAGVVKGGQAVNIIPDFAELELDIRYETMEEMRKIEAVLEQLTGHAKAQNVTVVEKKRTKTPPMEPSEKTYAFCELAKEVCAELDQNFAIKKRGGLSDANHISACGCATIDGVGPTGDLDHSEGEYLDLSTIEPHIDFAYGLLCKLAERK